MPIIRVNYQFVQNRSNSHNMKLILLLSVLHFSSANIINFANLGEVRIINGYLHLETGFPLNAFNTFRETIIPAIQVKTRLSGLMFFLGLITNPPLVQRAKDLSPANDSLEAEQTLFYSNQRRRFEHCEANLNETKHALLHSSSHRHQRDLFSALLGGVSLGLGIYNTIELKKLRNTQTHMLHYIDYTSLKINENIENVKALNTSVQVLNHNLLKTNLALRAESFRGEIQQNVQTFCSSVSEFSTAISHLLHSQLSLNLFSERDLRTFYEKAQHVAKQNKYFLVYKHFLEILNSDVSFFVEGDRVRIYVHIPLSSYQSMAVYKLQPSPMRIENNTFVIVDDDSLIAVKDHQFFELKDLSKCKRASYAYFCESEVLQRKRNSCVYSLYKNLDPHAYCNFVYLKEETIWRLSNQDFVGFFPEETHVVIANGSLGQKFTRSAFGIWRFNLQHDSRLETESHLVEPMFDLELKVKQISFQSYTQLHVPIPDVEDILKYLPKKNQKSIDIQNWHRMVENANSHNSQIFILTFAVVTCTLIVAFLLFVFCTYEYQRVKTKRRANNNAPGQAGGPQ